MVLDASLRFSPATVGNTVMRGRGSGTGLLEQFTLAGLLVAAAVFLTLTDWLWRWDGMLYDAHLKLLSRPQSEDIVIVAIDEDSLSLLGRWPWSRRVHAALIDRLTTEEAQVIALDLIFAEADSSDSDGDAELAHSMRRSGRVVLPVLVEQPRLSGQLIERLPISQLAAAAASLGHVHVELDKDGIVRSVYLKAGLGEPHWPALSAAMLDTAQPALGSELPGLRNPNKNGLSGHIWARDHHILIPFAGSPGHFSRIPYAQVLRGEYAPGTFKDKFVLVGVTAAGLGDAIPTPVSGHSQPMPGVELNANVLDAIRQGVAIYPLGLTARLTLSALLALLPMLVYPRVAPRWSLAAVGLLLILTSGLSAGLLVGWQHWFPPGAALLVIALSYPLWSWRRLESAMRYLDMQLERLRNEQAAAPRVQDSSVEVGLRFLGSILPLRGWVVHYENGTRKAAEGDSLGEPPASLSSGIWTHRGHEWWALAAGEASDCRVGLLWTPETPPDLWQRTLLDEIVQGNPPRSDTAVTGTVEVVQARIQQVQKATERLQEMRCFIDDSLAQMDGVLVVSGLGQVLLANQHAAFYLGGSGHDNLLNKSLLDLLSDVEPEGGISWQEALRCVLIERSPVQLSTHQPSGRDLLVKMAPLDSEAHQIGRLIINLSDITSLKDSERRRAEVLWFLSHDLRSPLVSILALVELARNKQEPDELLALFNRAEIYTKKTLQLADQFLALARAESSEEVRWRDVNLVNVVMNALEQTWIQAQSKQIDLSQDLAIDEAWVKGDPDLLERAIINLLTNAIRYSPQHSAVTLQLFRRFEEFHCCVTDTGYGIAQRDLPKLFSRFGRIATAQGGESGTGLGLALVKAVADRHNGRVEVESALGEGSCFRLIVPVEHKEE